jgi:hypothetical protein
VLIRRGGANTPHAVDGLAADAGWSLSGVVLDSSGRERVVEIGCASLDGATAFAREELSLSGTWADPDGDGNYCIVD